MKEQCSVTNRKKNRHDAVAHPVFLRRNTLRPPVTLESVTAAVGCPARKPRVHSATTAVGTQRPQSARRVANGLSPSATKTQMRPTSARDGASIAAERMNENRQRPPSTSAETEMYDRFRTKLLDEILLKGLHDEESLQNLFIAALEENPKTAHSRFQRVLERVILDLCDYLNVTFDDLM